MLFDDDCMMVVATSFHVRVYVHMIGRLAFGLWNLFRFAVAAIVSVHAAALTLLCCYSAIYSCK